MIPGVGIIGINSFVDVLIPLLRENGFKVESIWGHLATTVKEYATKFNIPHYSNKIEDVILQKNVELIFIASLPHLHSQVAVQGLGIGKHVICAVPPSLSIQHILKMIEASQYYPSLISVLCYTLRYLPAFVQMKKCVMEGFVGDVTICEVRIQCEKLLRNHYDWMCEYTMGGGLLTNVGSHIIDILTYLTGKKAYKVHGIMQTYFKDMPFMHNMPNRDITSDDFCSFQMELEGGTFVTVTLNSHFPGKFLQEVLICGTKGYLVVRNDDLYGQNNSHPKESALYLGVEEVMHWMQYPFKDSGKIHQSPTAKIPKLFLKSLTQMINALKEFFITGRHDGKKEHPIAATFEDGLYVQAVIDAIRQSTQDKKWINVEHPHRNSMK